MNGRGGDGHRPFSDLRPRATATGNPKGRLDELFKVRGGVSDVPGEVIGITDLPQDLRDLADLRAEVHRFTLELTEASSGDWRLARAAWTRASLSDLL